jgi:hypothetical protein
MSMPSQNLIYLDALAITHLFEWDAKNTENRIIVTLEDINIDPWNAVNLALPENAPVAFLKQVRETALFCLETQTEKFLAAWAGDSVPEGYCDMPYPKPDAHEFYEQDYLNAGNRVALLDLLLKHGRMQRIVRFRRWIGAFLTAST